MPGITNPAEAYFKDGGWSWDGTVWRKQPMMFGYSDRYSEVESSVNVAAGSHNLDFTVVPAGEIWVVNAISARCSTANPSSISVLLNLGGNTHYLLVQTTVVAWIPEIALGAFVLKEGDFVRATFAGCSLNDDIYAQASGYKMSIVE